MKKLSIFWTIIIFYFALIIVIISNIYYYSKNKTTFKKSNNLQISVFENLITPNIFLFDTADNIDTNQLQQRLKLLKNYKVNNIVFSKLTLDDFQKKGLINIIDGNFFYDLMFSSNILLSCSKMQLTKENFVFKNNFNDLIDIAKQLKIKKEHSYIFVKNDKIFAFLLEILNKKLNTNLEIANTKISDVIFNVITIPQPEENYIHMPLFYNHNIIDIAVKNGFNVIFNDLDNADLDYFSNKLNKFSIIAVDNNYTDTNLFDYNLFANYQIGFNNNIFFKYNSPNKFKYKVITDKNLLRAINLKNFFEKDILDLVIISIKNVENDEYIKLNLQKLTEQLHNSNKQISETLISRKISDPPHYIKFFIWLLFICFFILLFLRSDSLLWLGYTCIFITYSFYLFKIKMFASKYYIWQMGALQITAIQIFFYAIEDKKIYNLIKGIALLIIFYYISLISMGQHIFSVLHIPLLSKSIIVIFQLLSFAFGLFIYRKNFENKAIYNFIHILMAIIFTILVFRNDMGFENLFINFYDKITRAMFYILI